jgi:hypothetical protein
MSFRITWDRKLIENQLRAMSAQVNNHYNDGFTQWEIKKDLLEIKYLLDEILETSPTFSGEPEYFELQAKRKTWKILNEKTNSR